MIERIIELSIRNRFLVLIVTGVLTIAGVYATLQTAGNSLAGGPCYFTRQLLPA